MQGSALTSTIPQHSPAEWWPGGECRLVLLPRPSAWLEVWNRTPAWRSTYPHRLLAYSQASENPHPAQRFPRQLPEFCPRQVLRGGCVHSNLPEAPRPAGPGRGLNSYRRKSPGTRYLPSKRDYISSRRSRRHAVLFKISIYALTEGTKEKSSTTDASESELRRSARTLLQVSLVPDTGEFTASKHTPTKTYRRCKFVRRTPRSRSTPNLL
ncbi:hypothetical protein BDK51DRAFT_50791 [Blyttiomyces helicus]|uniref:Uncharacterized protein n=1 Tax=Blyttiomyces helicus TaxID=388810 RepID=A0A4P9VZN7_9FUNG|nr:hypothetical protein BDK51DRAFT_50791 [Blyttiomyces helicus]|eukprot:RKO83296.1 hypothetical protein BDK51DRAFT_50791 [Blyttiomyces helicus]